MFEAIPNVSEGRDSAVIEEIEAAIRDTPGVLHLGTASDPDHNRTVFSYAADDSEGIRRATLALFERAVERIDLRSQQGEHPRVGAVDVVPIVPLGTTVMDDCVALAEEIGAAVSGRFGIPVFLYEYAAREDYRRTLPAIRGGGLARLSEKMQSGEWRPDFGPPTPHPTAGVSVIGARRHLIAFNVQLSTSDIDVAAEIARAVREVSGGLAALRALPIRLAHRGIVQVSMNLLDFKRTSLWTAFEAVRREANARGVEIVSTELIGLAPAEALLEAAAQSLSIENFSRDLVLEFRLEELRGR